MGLRKTLAALFGPTPKQAPSTDSLNEDARQYRLAKAVAEAQERGLEVGDDRAIARLAAEYAVAPTDIMAALPNGSRIAAAGRKAMQATQASRDANSAEVIGEALDYCERPALPKPKLSEAAHDPEALARLLAGPACPPFPPIETPSGSVPLQFRPGTDDPIDVPPGAPVVATPEGDRGPSILAGLNAPTPADACHWPRCSCLVNPCPTRAGKLGAAFPMPVADDTEVICPACTHSFRAIPPQVQSLLTDAGFEPPFTTAGAPPRPLGAIETEAQRRTRLLAEWEAHRAAEPMATGRVPGEPMPRTEAELIGQAFLLLNRRGAGGLPNGEHLPHVDDMRLFFSMALTYCRFERAHFYEEHDGNRLVASMVRSARGMA